MDTPLWSHLGVVWVDTQMNQLPSCLGWCRWLVLMSIHSPTVHPCKSARQVRTEIRAPSPVVNIVISQKHIRQGWHVWPAKHHWWQTIMFEGFMYIGLAEDNCITGVMPVILIRRVSFCTWPMSLYVTTNNSCPEKIVLAHFFNKSSHLYAPVSLRTDLMARGVIDGKGTSEAKATTVVIFCYIIPP